ncbi:SH3 domain-binding protein 2 isoform X2 [Gouania willdenowi]|nr:SH3 domain-binding protein 2 isoform X2 [Gouania willdenowi]XP_028318689.1 SH3 domain-binding protein 2 isoform X2 [Gouania willdenowi]XP_028318690.1 SH3 domain-binding protein 2 isoform X2 [Gouania willdenowi]
MSVPEVCWPAPMRAIGAQNLLTMPGGVSTAGYLHKKGGSQFSLMKWPLRYVIIHRGCVYYFKSSTSASPQGAFSLNGYNRVMRASEETTSNNVFPFKIIHFSKKHRTWFFSAASEDERRKWMRQLRKEIDHYNDRKECHVPSDSDSDSFYGTIEMQMDIKHPVVTEDDFAEDEDEEEEEDYLKPDDDCLQKSTSNISMGRPAGPPPSYPPPPVPAFLQPRPSSSQGFHKSPPPTVPNRTLTSKFPKKPLPPVPSPSFPILKDNAPPLPPPNVHQHPTLPPPPLPVSGKPHPDRKDWRSPPICDQLDTCVLLNGPTRCESRSVGSSCQQRKLSLGAQTTHLTVNQGPSGQAPRPGHRPRSPLLKTGLHKQPETPKPPLPTVKPPLPTTKPKQIGTSIQRASPDGQSFRSLEDVTPTEFRRKRDLDRLGGGDDSDEDYENMLLPDSVFIDSTETYVVEKLFRENHFPPQDGLYGIRNSGTKTSKVLVVWDGSLGKARNYRLFKEDDCVFLESAVTFPSLSALIEHYYDHLLPQHDSLRLQKPFTKSV